MGVDTNIHSGANRVDDNAVAPPPSERKEDEPIKPEILDSDMRHDRHGSTRQHAPVAPPPTESEKRMTRRTLTARDIMPNSDDPERELRELRDSVLASFPDQAPPRALPAELQGCVPVAAPPTESDELSTNTDDYELEERPERIFATPSPQSDVSAPDPDDVIERLNAASVMEARQYGPHAWHKFRTDLGEVAAALLRRMGERIEQLEPALAEAHDDTGRAHDEIKTLQQENERLRTALEKIANTFDGETGLDKIARAALERQTDGK